MEVVLLLVVMAGAALIVVPRMQRRRAAAPSRKRKPAVAAAAAPAATWSPSDGWDDDLGWEGPAESSGSEAREKWDRWREKESPLASSASEPAELPSVERWRETAATGDWEADDGLGWEGSSEPTVTRDDNGRGTLDPREFETVATAAPPAAEPAEWEPGRMWGAGTDEPAAPAAVSAPGRRKRMLSPVALVAIYAAAGIGLVVLASTALLGGSPDPAPAVVKPPVKPVAAKPAPAPVVAQPADVDAAAEAEAAAAAAARKAQTAFERGQARSEKAAERALDKAKAAERRRRREEKSTPPATTTAPSGGTQSVPAPSYRAPAPRRSECEFCIG